MQRMRLSETDNTLIEIPFTTVLASNLQSRILAAALANASIVVKVKQPGVTTAVSGAGSFVTCDDTNAPGVRGYRPSTGERALGVCTFVFTGTNMEPREVPVMIIPDDPYANAIFGSVIAGTLTTAAFSTDLTPTNTDQYKDCWVEFLSGVNAGAVKKIGNISTAAGKVITLASGYTLPAAPSAADKFRIVTH